MRKLLAACLLVAFAALAMADTFVCPDGCETAATSAAADRCNTSGACVFCVGGAVVHAADVVVARLVPTQVAYDPPVLSPRASLNAVPDQPPRHA